MRGHGCDIRSFGRHCQDIPESFNGSGCGPSWHPRHHHGPPGAGDHHGPPRPRDFHGGCGPHTEHHGPPRPVDHHGGQHGPSRPGDFHGGYHGPFGGCGPHPDHHGPPRHRYGPEDHQGRPEHHHGTRGHHGPDQVGPGFFRPGPPGCYFTNHGPFFGPRPYPDVESGNCCQGFERRGRASSPEQPGRRGCPDVDQRPPRYEGLDGPCGRPCNRSRGRSPRRHCSPNCRGPPGPREYTTWIPPPNFGQGPIEHGRHPSGPRGPGGRCGRDRSRERGPCHGDCGPSSGPGFRSGHGPGPYDRCSKRRPTTDDESGNETDRRKKGPCCRKNKDANRDTILVQRIVVEKAPRCYSV